MKKRALTEEEDRQLAIPFLEDVRLRLEKLSANDAALLGAIRRRVSRALATDERGSSRTVPQTVAVPAGRRDARRTLEQYGFYRPFGVRVWQWFYAGTAIGIAVALGVVFGPQVASAAVAVGAFGLGFQQWRAARSETSMDRFYDRLELGDRRLDGWPAARALVEHLWPGGISESDYQQTMYVYVELDNLEYAAAKYRLGYMSSEQALRGLRTFRSRCESAAFRELAGRLVKVAGYHQVTRDIVSRICPA